MKTIFRSTGFALLIAAILTLGAVAGFAQDCDEAAMTAQADKVRELFTKKDIPGRKAAIEAGKVYLEKFGSCPAGAEMATYLKDSLPKREKTLAQAEKDARLVEIGSRFDAGLKSKNWDAVYAAGKQLLDEDPEKYRPALLVLGTIGYDETAKSPRVTKWNDDTLKYAKLAIADLEAGKPFAFYGVQPFEYKAGKDEAIGWMNLIIGYIMSWDKNQRKEALPYLDKAIKSSSTAKNDWNLYETIGQYYFDEAAKMEGELKTMRAAIKDTDAPEVVKQKVDALNEKIGISNGTLERAMDAYARTYKMAPTTPAGKAYRDGILGKINDLYDARFNKKDGVNAWIEAAVVKPIPSPLTAVTPVIDPEPAAAATSSSTAPATAAKPTAPAAKAATTAKP